MLFSQHRRSIFEKNVYLKKRIDESEKKHFVHN